MTNFFTMFKKEIREQWKSYKILFVPVVFIILMVTQPISMKLLPTLLKNEMPKGAVIHIPTPNSAEIMATIFGKFESMGIILLIIITMGAIAGERDKGITSLVLSKPIKRSTFFLSKWAAYTILALGSFVIGMIVSAYYTVNLFHGNLLFGDVTISTVLYLPVIMLIISISLCFSSFIKSPMYAGFLSVATYFLIMKIPPYLFKKGSFFIPDELITKANDIIVGKSVSIEGPLITVLILNLLFVLLGNYLLTKQEI